MSVTEPRFERPGGLRSKLVRVFILQLLAISVATILGVLAAAIIVERVLVREALNGEAEHFWSLFRDDHQFPLPNTNNLRGYLAMGDDHSQVPDWLAHQSAGFRRVSLADRSGPLVHVSEHGDARLFLVFDQVQVSALALTFGIAPLTGVLLLIYMLTWLGYVVSRRAVSTVVKLADSVRNYDLRSGEFELLSTEEFGSLDDAEVLTLVNAFNQFVARMEAFIQRERTFARNASHELRTPLAVFKANLDLLDRFDEPERRQAVLMRMRRTVDDMEDLVETLLILARETESQLAWSTVNLNEVLTELLDQVQRAVPKAQVSTMVVSEGVLEVEAPGRVLAIVFMNLLRNAMLYTDEGEVRVIVGDGQVSIQDSGCGMSDGEVERMFEPFYRGQDRSTPGYGLGMAIVRRLCDRFGWPLSVTSEPNVGTEIRIEFPRSRFRANPAVIGRAG